MRENVTLSDTVQWLLLYAFIVIICRKISRFLQMQIVCLDHRYNEPQTPDLFPILFIFLFISNLVFNISSIKIPII